MLIAKDYFEIIYIIHILKLNMNFVIYLIFLLKECRKFIISYREFF